MTETEVLEEATRKMNLLLKFFSLSIYEVGLFDLFQA